MHDCRHRREQKSVVPNIRNKDIKKIIKNTEGGGGEERKIRKRKVRKKRKRFFVVDFFCLQTDFSRVRFRFDFFLLEDSH